MFKFTFSKYTHERNVITSREPKSIHSKKKLIPNEMHSDVGIEKNEKLNLANSSISRLCVLNYARLIAKLPHKVPLRNESEREFSVDKSGVEQITTI